MLRRTIVGLTALVGVATAGLALFLPRANPAEPDLTLTSSVQGAPSWAVLLCRFSDYTKTPHDAGYYRDLFTETGRGKGGFADFFARNSYGRINLSGTTVHGWFTMDVTVAEGKEHGREGGDEDCLDAAAKRGYHVPPNTGTIFITNVDINSYGGRPGWVYLGGPDKPMDTIAHEWGHGLGLNHAFSVDRRQHLGGGLGEYDNEWDVMGNAYAGAGYGGFQRDRLGWLPRSRVITVGADGNAAAHVNLAPLEDPNQPGMLYVRVPFDVNDPAHYYTVELRKQGPDIPDTVLLINEVRNDQYSNGTCNDCGDPWIKPYLLRRLSDRQPLQTINRHGVIIKVLSMNDNGASLTIASGLAHRCLPGYVWRQARPADHACVTAAARRQVIAENSAAPSHWTNGPYGPHTCIDGYVWREAFSGDEACVTPGRRDETRAENRASTTHTNPARFTFGPNTCDDGYVWREADDRDYVCVSPEVRTRTRATNAAAATHWVNGKYGPHTCRTGLVWREAFTGDDVCVTPEVRDRTRKENLAAPDHLAYT